ncbi:MAG: hypothetical protein Q9P44_19185 [Anaerolineae bacterium]|nr:hypothetical protein [Anaerolineae bacterium]
MAISSVVETGLYRVRSALSSIDISSDKLEAVIIITAARLPL